MNNRKTPRIRFKGFTDDWEQRKLSELVAKYEDPVETPHGGYIRLGIRSHAKGTFHEYVEPGHELETAKMHRVATNKLIFNITFAWEHAVAIANENDAGKLVSHRFPQFTLLESLRPEFLKYVILDEGFHHNLYLASPGGAGRNRVLKIEEALDYPIYYPSLEEQHKIGGLLNKLNDLITLHQRKLEKLKIVKKAMLENCFPKNGEKVPRFRFSGFTGDWEQRKVGELTNVLSASRVHKEEWAEDGVPFFRSSDVVSAFKGTENEKAFISVELYEQLAKSSGKLEQNDILITGGGSIGIPYIMPDNKPLYSKDADLIWIKHSANFDSIYLYTYFMSEEFREYLASISHTGTIAHYTIEQVKDTPVRLPSIDEQRKLGNFFVSLDHLITLHQRKLEKLKIIKKFFLEKMFV